MVSPFIPLPVANTLPSTYKKLPTTLPPSSTSVPGKQSTNKYVLSRSGHAAHPDEILASCQALRTHIQKVQDDADEEFELWQKELAARDLADKRRVAPGWLDSDARILQPEKLNQGGSKIDSQNIDMSNIDVSESFNRESEEIDRVFGTLKLKQS